MLTSDGRLLGHVTHVLGDLSEDVFDGIGVRHGIFGQVLVPRSAVGRITRGAVHLLVAEPEVGKVVEKYAEERVYDARGDERKPRWRREEDDERF